MLLSKAGLAVKLGLSKSRISQYIRRGMPVRLDGSIDEGKAVEWIKRTIRPMAGGWGPGLSEQRMTRPAAATHRGEHNQGEFDSDPASDLAMFLCDPTPARAFVGAGLALGCTLRQTYGMLFEYQRAVTAEERRLAGENPADVVNLRMMPVGLELEDEYWQEIAAKAGRDETADIELWWSEEIARRSPMESS